MVLILIGMACGIRGGYGDALSFGNEEQIQPYEFGYQIKDDRGNSQERKETGNMDGSKIGAYSYKDAFGVYRQVEYTADSDGFRVNVKTNEPGTANQNPADVTITSKQSSVGVQDKLIPDTIRNQFHKVNHLPTYHQIQYSPEYPSSRVVSNFRKELLQNEQEPGQKPTTAPLTLPKNRTIVVPKDPFVPITVSKVYRVVYSSISMYDIIPNLSLVNVVKNKQTPSYVPNPVIDIKGYERGEPRVIQYSDHSKVIDLRAKTSKLQSYTNDEIPVYKDR
ncbi:uncharacterized protein LOC143258127 isoform X2 [Tachypleus tridentatus]